MRRPVAVFLCVLAYLALALIAAIPAFVHGPSHVLQCGGCGDVGQEVWFLRWPLAAISHDQSLLVSGYLNVPDGVNLMQNTSMPLLGLVAAPLVALVGPIASLNVAFVVAFASSAAAVLPLALRLSKRISAAFVAGLLYGFSPFMVGQGRAHLFLVAGALPPLMALCLHELLVRRRRPLLAAVALGLLAAAQFLVSIEVLVVFGLLGAAAVLAVLVAHSVRRPPPSEGAPAVPRGRLLAELLLAATVFGGCGALPASVLLAGPNRPSTPGHPQAVLAHLSTDLAGIVLPNGNELLDFNLSGTTDRWVRQSPTAAPRSGDLDENGGYVGLPLLCLILAGVVRRRRDQVVRLLAALAALALLLSLGSRLQFAGHSTPVPLPFALLVRVPLLQGAVAARFSDGMWLCLALLSARLLGAGPSTAAGTEHSKVTGPLRAEGRSTVETALAVTVGLLAAASLVPAWPYSYRVVAVPPWFTSAAARAVPEGTSVLAYPFPRKPHAEEMLWQAVAGFGFRIPGGQAIFGKTRTSATETVFDACLATGTPAPLTAHRIALMRGDLRAFDVSRVVVPLSSLHSRCAVLAMSRVLARPGRLVAGSEVWSVPEREPAGRASRSASRGRAVADRRQLRFGHSPLSAQGGPRPRR